LRHLGCKQADIGTLMPSVRGNNIEVSSVVQ
jgi:hypothetical protein